MKGQSSFHAWHSGFCRGCGKRYRKGDNVWSPKPRGGLKTATAGLLHIACQPPVITRQATPEEIQAVKKRSAERKRGIYSS